MLNPSNVTSIDMLMHKVDTLGTVKEQYHCLRKYLAGMSNMESDPKVYEHPRLVAWIKLNSREVIEHCHEWEEMSDEH